MFWDREWYCTTTPHFSGTLWGFSPCCNKIQRISCNNFFFFLYFFLFFKLKVTPLSSTPQGSSLEVWLLSSVLQSHILQQTNKRQKVKPGAPVWKVEWVYGRGSEKTSSLFVSEAPSSASQRTSSCYGQLDQCLNCLHWIFRSYQRPSWHQWWTSPGFDTWNKKGSTGEKVNIESLTYWAGTKFYLIEKTKARLWF